MKKKENNLPQLSLKEWKTSKNSMNKFLKNLNLTNYINWLQERNRSSGTIQVYCQYLQQFLQRQPIINTDSLRNFLKQHLTYYQPNSLKIFRQALSSYAKFNQIELEWEKINGIIPKIGRKFFDTLTPTELEQLKATKSERSEKTYRRNNLIFDFLFYSGLRVSELVNIRHSDWQGKSLRIHSKGNKIRPVFLPPFLISYFNSNSGAYLFTNRKKQPLSSLVIRQIIQQRVKKAGIEKNITPHSFRRSFATHLHSQKAQLTTIQMLLGHESINTTERYIQPDFDYLYQDYSKIWKNNPNLRTWN